LFLFALLHGQENPFFQAILFLVGQFNFKQMGLILFIRFQLVQPRAHFVDVTLMRTQVVFTAAPLCRNGFQQGFQVFYAFPRLVDRRLRRVKPFGNLSLLFFEIMQLQVKLLELHQEGKLKIQKRLCA